jgi:hypothetical protein
MERIALEGLEFLGKVIADNPLNLKRLIVSNMAEIATDNGAS